MDYTAGPVQSHRSLRDGDAGVESARAADRSRGGPAGAPASWPPPGVDEVKAATFPGPRKELGPRTLCRLLPGTKVKGQLYVCSFMARAAPGDESAGGAATRPGTSVCAGAARPRRVRPQVRRQHARRARAARTPSEPSRTAFRVSTAGRVCPAP